MRGTGRAAAGDADEDQPVRGSTSVIASAPVATDHPRMIVYERAGGELEPQATGGGARAAAAAHSPSDSAGPDQEARDLAGRRRSRRGRSRRRARARPECQRRCSRPHRHGGRYRTLNLSGLTAHLLAHIGQRLERDRLEHPLSEVARASSKRPSRNASSTGMACSAAPSSGGVATVRVPEWCEVPAETLKRRLTADVEHVTDLGPRMACGASLLDEPAQSLLDESVEATSRGDRPHQLVPDCSSGRSTSATRLHVGGQHQRHDLAVELQRRADFLHACKDTLTSMGLSRYLYDSPGDQPAQRDAGKTTRRPA